MTYILTLKKNEEKRLLQGHPWVYANEVAKIEGKDVQGSIARVYSFDGRYIGSGYINHASKIIVRLLTRTDEEIDRDFFKKKIENAWEKRKKLGFSNSCRVIFGEADGLPALIVDKYGDYLSVQFLALGMEKRKDMIVDILVEVFKPKGIYERSDVKVREKEGLPLKKSFLYGTFDPVVLIEENGIKMFVDLENGQKTGYFLDQKENRLNIRRYIDENSEVLDCFCHTGGFSLNAAKAGAKEVVACDISETALKKVEENAKLNGFTNITTECADVFEKLRDYKKEGRKFDLIVLDPPAFTKTSDKVKDAIKGYNDINVNALKIVKSGGYLATFSCSHYLTVPLFLDMIKSAATQSGRKVSLIELRTQSRDHPSLLGTDESLYLKCAILEVD